MEYLYYVVIRKIWVNVVVFIFYIVVFIIKYFENFYFVFLFSVVVLVLRIFMLVG